jgi:hypothetical protein
LFLAKQQLNHSDLDLFMESGAGLLQQQEQVRLRYFETLENHSDKRPSFKKTKAANE